MDDMMKKIGIIVTLIVIVFGSYCTIDLFKILNIKSAVIGYFYTEPEVVKISDFEYDITSLLFYSADNENQYYATVNAKPVSNFDSTKKYTVTINGIKAKAVDGNYNFVNANFTNQFNSSLDEVILTDTLNIKINFYKEGTKILLVTNGGEQAVSLWSSYIQKNGFILKIIETNYSSKMEADNLPSYTLNLYYNDEIYQTINFNAINNVELPKTIENQLIQWKLDSGEVITNTAQLHLSNTNLYAEIVTTNLTINTKELIFDSHKIMDLTATTGALFYNLTYQNSANIELNDEVHQNICNKGLTPSKDALKVDFVINDFYGLNTNNLLGVALYYEDKVNLTFVYSGIENGKYYGLTLSIDISFSNNGGYQYNCPEFALQLIESENTENSTTPVQITKSEIYSVYNKILSKDVNEKTDIDISIIFSEV